MVGTLVVVDNRHILTWCAAGVFKLKRYTLRPGPPPM